jgi:hypothetical protein
MSVFRIYEFIAERFGVPLNIGDVEKVGLSWNAKRSLQQMEAMGEYLWAEYGGNGRFHVKSLETSAGPEALRIGAFSQTPEERLNLSRYGDVIALDGRQIDRPLKTALFIRPFF